MNYFHLEYFICCLNTATEATVPKPGQTYLHTKWPAFVRNHFENHWGPKQLHPLPPPIPKTLVFLQKTQKDRNVVKAWLLYVRSKAEEFLMIVTKFQILTQSNGKHLFTFGDCKTVSSRQDPFCVDEGGPTKLFPLIRALGPQEDGLPRPGPRLSHHAPNDSCFCLSCATHWNSYSDYTMCRIR